MKEGKLLDISHLLIIKNYADRHMEVEYPYPNMLPFQGTLDRVPYHFVESNKKLPLRKPIDIFTGLGEIRKRRIMRAIQKGKNETTK